MLALKEGFAIQPLSYLVLLVLVDLSSLPQSFDQLNLSFSSLISLYCRLLSILISFCLYLLFGNHFQYLHSLIIGVLFADFGGFRLGSAVYLVIS